MIAVIHVIIITNSTAPCAPCAPCAPSIVENSLWSMAGPKTFEMNFLKVHQGGAIYMSSSIIKTLDTI